MSDFLESGLHPDADQLNAFAEHVLPPHEQEQVLAHLTACSDCRAVISLAIPKQEDDSLPQVEPVRKPWLSGWNLVWPVAFAVAALVPIVLHVRNHGSTGGNDKMQTEVAASHLPERLAPRAEEQPAAKQAIPAPANRVAPARRTTGRLPTSNRHIAAPASGINAPAKDRDAVIRTSDLPANNLQTSPGNFIAGRVVGGTQDRSTAAKSSIVSGIDSATAAPQTPVAVPSQAESQTATASSASQAVKIRNGNLGLAKTENSWVQSTLKVPELSPLPSGLPTLSTTSTGLVTLALDTRNTLFYSSDNGSQWKMIRPQWKGHAIQVNLVSNSAANRLHGAARSFTGSSAAANAAALDKEVAASALSSSLGGTITDGSGAGVPNATVAVNTASRQTVQTTKADASGHYLISGLSAGTYQIEAAAPGFQKLELPVTLASAQQNVSNLRLQVGSVSETVRATADSQAMVGIQSLAKKSAVSPAPARPAPLFEITTDTGEHWVSFDGENWARK
jgi:hypothetical protein